MGEIFLVGSLHHQFTKQKILAGLSYYKPMPERMGTCARMPTQVC